jgi:pimeloyl-ACP methyl ester carboxylesterase
MKGCAMHFEHNGVRLAYTVRGSGLPILLVHAFPLAGAMWTAQMNMLESHYQVLIPDLRGFGQSSVPTTPSTMPLMADDLYRLLVHLDLKKVVVVGLSMGGYIAFELLRRYPHVVHALVLADTRATSDSPEAQAARETNARIAETQGAAAIADLMIPRLLAPNADPAVVAQVREMILATAPAGIAAALRGMAVRADATDLLPHIRVPTLLIGGEQDQLTPPVVMQDLQQAIDGSSLTIVPRAGHLPNLEQAEVFNTALLKFLHRL